MIDKTGGNIIDSVVLTPEVVEAWKQACKAYVATAKRSDKIGIEQAYSQPDGSLVICCQIGDEEVSISVPQDHWSIAN